MTLNLTQIGTCVAFLVVNVIVLLAILKGQRSGSGKQYPPTHENPPQSSPEKPSLDPAYILGWEYEYARSTASEAMAERHTLVNFYLLVAGVLVSGVVAVLGQDFGLPRATGTVLLWLLCGIGWLYFLAVIRLRQAWHGSARAMNRIKDFWIRHSRDFKPEVLREAFLWKPETLPRPDRPWTVYFYSTMVIAFVDSVAYVVGGALIDLDAVVSAPLLAGGPVALLGLVFFAFHVWLYSAFLKP